MKKIVKLFTVFVLSFTCFITKVNADDIELIKDEGQDEVYDSVITDVLSFHLGHAHF